MHQENLRPDYLLSMCVEVLVVLRGSADTLDVFSGDMTDCIPELLPSLLKRWQWQLTTCLSSVCVKWVNNLSYVIKCVCLHEQGSETTLGVTDNSLQTDTRITQKPVQDGQLSTMDTCARQTPVYNDTSISQTGFVGLNRKLKDLTKPQADNLGAQLVKC